MRHQGENFDAGLSWENVLGFKGGQHFKMTDDVISNCLINVGQNLGHK